jgi:hypothetical protein
VSRHVVHVEAAGIPTPSRWRRQRSVLDELCRRYRTSPGMRSSGLRPRASFDFSTRTSPEQAVLRMLALLDEIDAGWRRDFRVWDGFPGGVSPAVHE